MKEKEIYFVVENTGAGEAWINSVSLEEYKNGDFTYQEIQGSHGSVVFETENYEEAEKYIEDAIERTKVFAVFFNNAANEGFVSEENCFSGNWEGSKYGHSSCYGKFDTEEEAYNYLEQLLS